MNSVLKMRTVCFAVLGIFAAVALFAGPDRMEAQTAAQASQIEQYVFFLFYSLG